MMRSGQSVITARHVGLARALSKLGYCSRTKAAGLIRNGEVRLNGQIRRDPETPVRLEKDKIEVSGKRIGVAEKIYLMLNKPRNVVTTASDEKGRKTVYDLLKPGQPWLSPVGRLDRSSEGLLLLTNDTEWAARVLDPETHLEKTYHVQVGAVVGEELSKKLRSGVKTAEGVLRAKRARILRGGSHNTWLEIALDEGKNRQIRRMLEQLNLEVLRLVRVSIGPLALGTLKKGESRSLSPREKLDLDGAMKA